MGRSEERGPVRSTSGAGAEAGRGLAWRALLLAACEVTLVDAAILQRKYGIFTGGFLQQDHLASWSRVGFLGLSLLLDAVAVAPFALLAAWLLARTGRFRRRQLIFTAACLGGLPIAVAIFVRFQVVRYFGDTIEYAVLRKLASGSLLEMAAQASSHLLMLGIFVAAALGGLVAGNALLARLPGGKSVPRRLEGVQGRWLLTVSGGLLVASIGVMVLSQAIAPGLHRQLGRKESARLVEQAVRHLTDFDRDGYGLTAARRDFAPFDSARYPYAIDWPDNAVDENGLGGDLTDVSLPGPRQRARFVRRPDVVLIFLESFRDDNIGASVNGHPVTPVIESLVAEGATRTSGYSHNGFSTSSRTHAFVGFPAYRGASTLIDDFNDNGYVTAVVSGSDESFGGIEEDTGMVRADIHVDARDDVERRVSAFTTSGSLHVPWQVVAENVRSVTGSVPTERPLFLYVNITDTHFPYHNYATENLLDVEPIPRERIGPDSAEWLQQTYRNASANLDRAVGVVLDTVEEIRGREPAYLIVGDHGESLFEDGVLGHGFRLSDDQLRVPVITRGVGPELRLPFALADIRDFLVDGLQGPPPASTRARFEEGRWVLVYTGSLRQPGRIGAVLRSGIAGYTVSAGVPDPLPRTASETFLPVPAEVFRRWEKAVLMDAILEEAAGRAALTANGSVRGSETTGGR